MKKESKKTGVDFKYLIVNEMDRKYGLWINTVGVQDIQPQSSYPLKDHPSGYFFNIQKGRILREYQLVYITQGRGLFSSEDTPARQVSQGHLILLFPGQWHTYYPYRQIGWTEYYIGFEGEFINRMVENGFLSKQDQVFEVGINEELVSLFTRALEVAEADKNSAQQYMAGILTHILGMVWSISKNKAFELSDVDQKIEKAKIIMNERVFQNIDLEELALMLGTSYSWFRKFFKEYTGYAPAKYFQELKIRKAKHLLVSTLSPVKEIAFILNYKSPEHFFYMFKKSTGLTPSRYRSLGRERIRSEQD